MQMAPWEKGRKTPNGRSRQKSDQERRRQAEPDRHVGGGDGRAALAAAVEGAPVGQQGTGTHCVRVGLEGCF